MPQEARFLDIDMTILLLLACELAKGYRYFITIISVSYIVIRPKMIKRSKKLIKLMLDNIRDCDAASLFSASVLRAPNTQQSNYIVYGFNVILLC